jgi:hypothetical protein
MITTTLNRIRTHGPCSDGWEKLLKGLGKTAADDEPLPYARIVEINGLDDALWCCRAEPQHAREWRLYAVWCARQVQHLMTDERSIAALNVAERHARGQASDAELEAAWAAAWEAEAAAWGAESAAREAESAARGAESAARAAESAARAATWAAESAARAAAWEAESAARAAALAEAKTDQTAEFLRVVNGGEQ